MGNNSLNLNKKNKFNKMKLGIISDAQHYYDHNGRLCTLSQLSKQFEQWAELFEEVIICAPLKYGLPPPLFNNYNKKFIKDWHTVSGEKGILQKSCFT